MLVVMASSIQVQEISMKQLQEVFRKAKELEAYRNLTDLFKPTFDWIL